LDNLPAKIRDFIGPIKYLEIPNQGAASNVVYVSTYRGEFVIKWASSPPFNVWLRQENKVLSFLENYKIPSPKGFLYVENHTPPVFESWLVMERLSGKTLRTRLQEERNSSKRKDLLYNFGHAIKKVHSNQFHNNSLDNFSWLCKMIDLAQYYLEHYEVEGNYKLLNDLVSNQPESVQEALIHGDCTLDNIMVSGNTITGFIDWCWGDMGDPRYDLVLATTPSLEAFSEKKDFDAFYKGYGEVRLTTSEIKYFQDLFKFF